MALPSLIPQASLYTVLALLLTGVVGYLSRRWATSDKRQEPLNDDITRTRAALTQARLDGDLPRQCALLQRLHELEEQAGIPPSP